MLVAQGRVLCQRVYRIMTASCLNKGCANFPEFLQCLWFFTTRTDFSRSLICHIGTSWPLIMAGIHWAVLAEAHRKASLSRSLVLSFFYKCQRPYDQLFVTMTSSSFWETLRSHWRKRLRCLLKIARKTLAWRLRCCFAEICFPASVSSLLLCVCLLTSISIRISLHLGDRTEHLGWCELIEILNACSSANSLPY